MYIRPISDIHTEFSLYELPELETDSRSVLVLAGDIALASRVESTLLPFLDSVADRFMDIVYVAGNHEYYQSSLLVADKKLREACQRYSNVHFLQMDGVLIGDVRFLGATLWTDLKGGDPIVRMTAEEVMNDYRAIRTGTTANPYMRKMNTADTIAVNKEHLAFFKNSLKDAEERGERVVMVCHHAPSFSSHRPDFKESLVDYAYYNGRAVENLILDYKPLLCIHGHTHYPISYELGDTLVVANPRGYSKNPTGYESSRFDPSLVLEI